MVSNKSSKNRRTKKLVTKVSERDTRMRETSKERKTRRRSAFAKVRPDIERKKKREIELKLIKAKSIPRISSKEVEKARRNIFAKLRKDITRKKSREAEWKLLKERVFNEIKKNEPLKIKRLQSEQKKEDRNSMGMEISPRTRFKAQAAKGTAYF